MVAKHSRPVAALVISLIAGVEIIVVSIILAILGGIISSNTQGGIGAIFGIIGIIWGILLIVSALLMYRRPEQHVLWGSLVIIFSIVSIFGAIGGIFIGLILGIIGGALGIIWSPNKTSAESLDSAGIQSK